MRKLRLSLFLIALTLSAQPRLGLNGVNRWFPLTPGHRLEFKHGSESQTITVLSETKTIEGVECRVVEDREMKNGKLTELTRDYYAIDAVTNDVYYMGEDVDVYKNGKVAGHEGAWLSGVGGAKYGLMMPGTPKAGQKFAQEQAPSVANDRAEVIAIDAKVVTPAGTFEHCIHTIDSGGGTRDHKFYAPGIGMIKDAAMVLVKYVKP